VTRTNGERERALCTAKPIIPLAAYSQVATDLEF